LDCGIERCQAGAERIDARDYIRAAGDQAAPDQIFELAPNTVTRQKNYSRMALTQDGQFVVRARCGQTCRIKRITKRPVSTIWIVITISTHS
jgi:hypothetical protein